jgi:hypothetical protein
MQANGDIQANPQVNPVKRLAPPLFYKKPLLLRSGPNAGSGLTAPNGYGFAAGAVAVPIGFSEFPRVARHYPIVFLADDLVPVAVLGVKPGGNLFVDSGGSWWSGHYVPACIRRYPFTLMAMAGCTEQMLAVDSASERFVWDADRAEGASRLFDDAGQPTATARSAMAFCQTFRDDCRRTEAFTDALRRAKLLVPCPFRTGLSEQSGFLSIDDQVFRKLTESNVTRWKRDSWLLLIALTVASARNWQALSALGHRRSAEQGGLT